MRSVGSRLRVVVYIYIYTHTINSIPACIYTQTNAPASSPPPPLPHRRPSRLSRCRPEFWGLGVCMIVWYVRRESPKWGRPLDIHTHTHICMYMYKIKQAYRVLLHAEALHGRAEDEQLGDVAVAVAFGLVDLDWLIGCLVRRVWNGWGGVVVVVVVVVEGGCPPIPIPNPLPTIHIHT